MYFKLDVKNLKSTLKIAPTEKNQALTILMATYKTAAFIENKAKRSFVERACSQHFHEVLQGTQPKPKIIVKSAVKPKSVQSIIKSQCTRPRDLPIKTRT